MYYNEYLIALETELVSITDEKEIKLKEITKKAAKAIKEAWDKFVEFITEKVDKIKLLLKKKKIDENSTFKIEGQVVEKTKDQIIEFKKNQKEYDSIISEFNKVGYQQFCAILKGIYQLSLTSLGTMLGLITSMVIASNTNNPDSLLIGGGASIIVGGAGVAAIIKSIENNTKESRKKIATLTRLMSDKTLSPSDLRSIDAIISINKKITAAQLELLYSSKAYKNVSGESLF
jgi:hypothetical protein